MILFVSFSIELWLDWLTDEKTLATTPEQKEKLVQLFERAVKDYACKNIINNYSLYKIIIFNVCFLQEIS